MRLAIDIGGTFIKCASVSDDGKIIGSSKFQTEPHLDTKDFSDHIVNGARKFIENGSGKYSLVGAGMAGFTDGRRGVVLESPNLPNVRNLELAKVLSDGLELPAYIENDATAAAWGEYLFGGHGDVKNMLVVTLGTGIGGGLVLDGRLYRGSKGMAGEIGQMVYEPGGAECGGGGRGCLEFFAGKNGLMEDYRKLSQMNEGVEPDVIFDNAVKDDPAAKRAFINYGYRLGVIFASSANLLDLDLIVLTGGIIGAWEFFGVALRDSIFEHAITPHKGTIHVKPTSLSGNAGILGAAFLDKAV